MKLEDYFPSNPSLAGHRKEIEASRKPQKKRNLATKVLHYLRPEPYNPDAIDGSTPPNGIVQEDTPWERPAGTRLLNDGAAELARWNRQNPGHPYGGTRIGWPYKEKPARIGKRKYRRIGPLVANRSSQSDSEADWEEAKRKITKIRTVNIPPVTPGKPIAKAVVRDESKIRGRKGVPQVADIDHQIMLNHVHDVKARIEKKYGDVSTVAKAKAALRKAYPNLESDAKGNDFGGDIGLTLQAMRPNPDGTMPSHTQGLVIALLDHADNYPDVAKSITTINNRASNDGQPWEGVTAVGPMVDEDGVAIGLTQTMNFRYSRYSSADYRRFMNTPGSIDPGDMQMLLDLEDEGVLSSEQLAELAEIYLASHEFGHAVNNYNMFKDLGIDLSKPWGPDQLEGFYDNFSDSIEPFDRVYNLVKSANPDASPQQISEHISKKIWEHTARWQNNDPDGFAAHIDNVLAKVQYDSLTKEQEKIASDEMSAISKYASTMPAEQMAEMFATRYLFMKNQADTSKIRKVLGWMNIKAASMKGPKSSEIDWSVKIGDTKGKKFTAKELEAISIPTCRAPDGRPGLILGLTSADKKGRKPETKTEFTYGIETKTGRPNLEPYDPDAIDGDNDGIVQEGTPWERPVGTRIFKDGLEVNLTSGGKKKQAKRATHMPGIKYIKEDGEEYDKPFTPGPIHKIQGRIGRNIAALRAEATRPKEQRVRVPKAPDSTKDVSRLRNGMSSRFKHFSEIQRKAMSRDFEFISGKTIDERVAEILEEMKTMDQTVAATNAAWYGLRHQELQAGLTDLHNEFGVDAPGMPTFETLTGLLAALSPRKLWESKDKKTKPNWDSTMSIAEVWILNPEITDIDIKTLGLANTKAGTRLQDADIDDAALFIRKAAYDMTGGPTMPAQAATAIRLLKSQDVDGSLNGSKVRSFYANLINGGYGDAVTIDVWMLRYISRTNSAPTQTYPNGKKKPKPEDLASWLTSGASQTRALEGLTEAERKQAKAEWMTQFNHVDGSQSASPVGVYPAFAEVLYRVTEEWNKANPDSEYTPSEVQALLWVHAKAMEKELDKDPIVKPVHRGTKLVESEDN